MKKYLLLCSILLLFIGSFSACGRNNAPQLPQAVILGAPIERFETAVAFWPGNEQLQAQIWAGLQVLSAEGVVSSLSHRYLGNSNALSIPPDRAAPLRLDEIAPRTLVIGISAEHAPFSFLDENGIAQGLNIALANALCQLFGWELEIVPVTWSMREFYLNSGNIDALWGASLTEQVRARLIHTPAFFTSEQVIITMSNSDITRLRDLQTAQIGVHEGSLSEYVAYQNIERLGTIMQYDTQRRLIWALENGRIAAIILDYHTARYLLTTQ